MNATANLIEDEALEDTWQSSIYVQLHQMAERALNNERPGHSLQPTLLVNDAYLRLLEQRNVSFDNRSTVMAVGATIIRRLLVDYARKRKSKKRGGERGRGRSLCVSIVGETNLLDTLELNDALEVLSEQRPRSAQVVELKFFGGLTSDEISEQLCVSVRTVKNDWRFAKAWLYRELSGYPDQTED